MLPQLFGDELISRTESAAAATVSEEHDAERLSGHDQLPLQTQSFKRNLNLQAYLLTSHARQVTPL
jgi:hypothetical protein